MGKAKLTWLDGIAGWNDQWNSVGEINCKLSHVEIVKRAVVKKTAAVYILL